MTKFILNNQTVHTDEASGSTVLDFIRYKKRLTGTKIGCREGDCGACTILVGSFENDELIYRSMTSCLMPLGNAAGKHIVTVEGINLDKKLSPVQQAMVDTNGTQCGFCTLGFVMSFTGFVLSQKKNYQDSIAAIDGNICRCTGYKSIERSAKIISDTVEQKPKKAKIDWLVAKGFLPEYFSCIEERLRQLKKDNIDNSPKEKVFNPSYFVAGGTDLIVQKATIIKYSDVQLVFDDAFLKGIKKNENSCYVGGGTTVTEFLESPIIREAFPDLESDIKLVSSTPIRNMATMAGNIVNASPIGDMTVFFLALDASIILKTEEQQRDVKLKDFYKGYKQLDKSTDEIITQIFFQLPSSSYFNFEKVSKRTNLDIASVNSACHFKLSDDGSIAWMHLSAGGVAPFPKYLSNTCAHLTGKKITTEVLEEALKIAKDEIAPISDARGSSDYKRLLLRQLIIAHFIKAFGLSEVTKTLLFQ